MGRVFLWPLPGRRRDGSTESAHRVAARGRPAAADRDRCGGARPAEDRPVGRRRGRKYFLLGAAARARQARFPSPRRIRTPDRMKIGLDRLLADAKLRKPLAGRRVALLAHPASVTAELAHSIDALVAAGVPLSAAFGPQHGLRGDKQDNMVESADFTDPAHGIPVFSLYGEVRRPTARMMQSFDVLLVDLQDLGCRVYTFLTTLRYVLEAAAEHRKTVWVLRSEERRVGKEG